MWSGYCLVRGLLKLMTVSRYPRGETKMVLVRDSFTKPPRGKNAFDLRELFGPRQFHKTDEGESFLVYGSVTKPPRGYNGLRQFRKTAEGKVFGL